MSLTPFFRLPNLFVRSTWSRFLSRSFKSELKWDGNRTCADVESRENERDHNKTHLKVSFSFMLGVSIDIKLMWSNRSSTGGDKQSNKMKQAITFNG